MKILEVAMGRIGSSETIESRGEKQARGFWRWVGLREAGILFNHTKRSSAEMVRSKSVPRRGDEMGAL